MDYIALHEKILADIRDNELGVRADFDHTVQGEYDEDTDRFADPTTNTYRGYAVEISGDPEEYRALDLIGIEAVTLVWVPLRMGVKPHKDSTLVWAGVLRTVKQIFPIRPAEELISARIVLV